MANSLVKDLVNRVQRLADRVDTSYRSRTLDAIDEAVQWYSSRVPHDSAINPGEVFVADGTEFLTLPDRVARVLTVSDLTNLQRVRPGSQWESRRPTSYLQRTGGTAQEWRPVGISPVISQPATDETLTFSTLTSESIAVQVRGLVFDSAASGTALALREVQESVQMAGVTNFSANYYRKVISIQKDKGTTNGLSVAYGSSLRAYVAPWDTRPMYQQIQLMFVPIAGTQLEISYQKRPDRITSEDDSLPGFVNEEAVMWRAAGNMHWMDNEGQAAQIAWTKADQELDRVRNEEQTHGEKSYAVNLWTPGGYMGLENLNGFPY